MNDINKIVQGKTSEKETILELTIDELIAYMNSLDDTGPIMITADCLLINRQLLEQ